MIILKISSSVNLNFLVYNVLITLGLQFELILSIFSYPTPFLFALQIFKEFMKLTPKYPAKRSAMLETIDSFRSLI